MSIGTPVVIGTKHSIVLADGHVEVPITTSVAIGDLIYVASWWADAAGATNVGGVVDSVGNTYGIDVQHRCSTDNFLDAAVASCKGATIGMIAGDTVRVNGTGLNSNSKTIIVVKCTGADHLDKVATPGEGVGTAWATGSSGTLSDPDELVMAFDIHNGAAASSTPNAGWTELEDVGNNFNRRVTQYQIVSATSAVSGGGTMASGNWTALLTTYMFGPPTPPATASRLGLLGVG